MQVGPFLAGWIPTTRYKGQAVGRKGIQKQKQNAIILPAEGPTLSLHTSRNRELTTQVQPLPSLSRAPGSPALGGCTWPGSLGLDFAAG